MKNNFKRVLAMLLAVITIVGCVAFPVSAADTTVEQSSTCKDGKPHTWTEEPVKTVEATCTEQGYDLYYCTTCYRYEQRNVVGTGKHEWAAMENAKLPTCDANGYPAGSLVCKKCGEYSSENPALDTEYPEYLKKTECGAACKALGTGKHDVTSEDCIHAWGNPVSEGKACLDKTDIKYTCTECKLEYTTKGDGHDWVYDNATLKAPTCHAATKADPKKGYGSIERYCSVCQERQTIEIERLSEHSYKPNSTKADSTYCGEKCTVCGTTRKTTTKHDFGEPVVTPNTCTKNGNSKKTCKDCGKTVTTTLKAPGHEKTEYIQTVNGTHTKIEVVSGYDEYYCGVCNSTWKDYTDELAMAHRPNPDGVSDQETIEPTCLDDGYILYKCFDCGAIVTDPKDAKGHVAASSTNKVEASKQEAYDCEEGGYYTHYCSRCKQEWVNYKTYINPGNHDYSGADIDEKPGCAIPGYKGKECLICGKRPGTIVPATPAEHDVKHLVTYGDGCVKNKVIYSYCATVGCEYNAKAAFDTFKTGKTEAEIIAELDKMNAGTSTTGVKVFRDDQGKKGYHEIAEEEVIQAPTCMTSGWLGNVCVNCDAEFKTKPVYVQDFEDYHNHEEGKQVIVTFRWTCDRSQGEELYSEYRCEACGRTYDAPSFIVAKDGIDLKTGTNGNVEGDILIYIGGVATKVDSFKVDAKYLKNAPVNEDGEIVSGSAHIWEYLEGGTPRCDKIGTLTCVLCLDTKEGETTDCKESKESGVYKETLGKNPCADAGTWESVCIWCGEKMTGVVPATGNHTYDQEVKCVIEDCDHSDIANCTYFKELPTCTKNAVYYKSCVCGANAKNEEYEEGDVIPTFEDANTTIPHVYNQKWTCSIKGCEHTDQTQCAYKGVIYLAKDENGDYLTNKDCQTQATYYYACVCGASSGSETDPEKQTTYKHGNVGAHVTRENDGIKLDAAAGQFSCTTYFYEKEIECELCETALTWTGFKAQVKHSAEEYTGKQTPYLDDYDDTTPNPAPVTGEKPYMAPTCDMLGFWYAKCEFCGEFEDENGNLLFPAEQEINDGTVDKNEDEKYPASINEPHYNVKDEILTGNCQYKVTYIDGEAEYICKYCGDPILPAHNYEAATTECGDRKCTICKEAVLEVEDEKHTYVKDETSTKEGVIVDVCEVCGKVKETIIPAVTFSMDIANPNGSVIVNGGKAYLTINMDCVNATMHSVYLELTAPAYLTKATAVEKGALGGNVMVYQNGTNVTVFADVGTEREEVTVKTKEKLCVIEFTVNYDAWIAATSHIENDVKETEISFVEPADTNQIMVLNYAQEEVAFDVKENKTLKFNIDQIGDIDNNGIINSVDALLLAQAINTKAEYNAVYDVNNDGVVNVLDYGRMMQYIVGILNYDHLVKNTEPTE